MHPTTTRIAALGDDVRYVAIAVDRMEPELWERESGPTSSSFESNCYEELLVNPALPTLAGRRGDIDCGGLDHLLVRYRSFYQLVVPTDAGHVSVCIDPDADVAAVTRQVLDTLTDAGHDSAK